MAHPRWCLIEAFGDKPPSLIGAGDKPKSMVPLDKFFARNGTTYRQATRALSTVIQTGTPFREHSGSRLCLAEPLAAYDGGVNGAWVWIGNPEQHDPGEHGIAGAWYFDLTSGEIGGSPELLDLYRQPPGERQTKRAMAEAFTRLAAGPDASDALAKLVQSKPGSEHEAVWTVLCDDGARRAAHFCCRAIQTRADDGLHVVMRGITHDIGPAEETPQAPPVTVLEQRVLSAAQSPGRYRAIVNVRTGVLMKWVDDPPDRLHWTGPGHRIIHPDDTAKVEELNHLTDGTVTRDLRFEGVNSDWVTATVTSRPMLLDNSTPAALWDIDLSVQG